ncbi:Abhydrolase-3 domain-containing protein [Fusarium sp. LHS14.1]|nr:Abhydrolase-3 domain-containing protein [Fusarium sp. LHS14.1]
MPLKFDPEFLDAIQPHLDELKELGKPAINDVEGQRARYNRETKLVNDFMPDTPCVDVVEHQVQSYLGGNITVFEFRAHSKQPLSLTAAIIHIHGGGMIAGQVMDSSKMLKDLTTETGLPVCSVDYRLAPEHPHPVPVEDCYAGLEWLILHAPSLDIDPERIAILGESAGGGLAACTAILARDRQLKPALAKQVLICPMLDDRNTKPIKELNYLASWTADDNVTGWAVLLGHDTVGGDNVSSSGAAARVVSMEGLPPLCIDVGGLDIFATESIVYAGRLAAGNIHVELHVYSGVPHGFELLAPDIRSARKAKRNRLRALMDI